MTNLTRRKFVTLGSTFGAIAALDALKPAFASAPVTQNILGKTVKLDKAHPWGRKKADILQSVLSFDNSLYINLQDVKRQLPEGQLDQVNATINQVKYYSDQTLHGVNDLWMTPDTFFEKGGDCEDFAIAKFGCLAQVGWSLDQLYVAALTHIPSGMAHSSLIVSRPEGCAILDNFYDYVVRDGEFQKNFSLVYAVNLKGLWRPV